MCDDAAIGGSSRVRIEAAPGHLYDMQDEPVIKFLHIVCILFGVLGDCGAGLLIEW